MNTPSTSNAPRPPPAISMHPFENVRTSAPLSWSSILAGCFAGLGIHLVLTMLGVGIGLGVIDPSSSESPFANFSIGAGIAWSLSALVALWIGGYVAGRSIPQGDRQSGLIHGLVVWAVATVAMFLFLSSTTGFAIAGTAKALGSGVSAATQAAGAAGDESGGGLGQVASQNANLVAPYLDELGQGTGQLAQRDLSPTAKREITISLVRFFGSTTPENRNRLITTLTDQGGIPRADAERMVGGWEASYNRMQENVREMRAEAAQAAREAADKASSAVSKVAIWTFIAFLVGAFAASFGGRAGATSATHREGTAELVQ